jgi:hypothetical protein
MKTTSQTELAFADDLSAKPRLNGGLDIPFGAVAAIREVLIGMRSKLVAWHGKSPPRYHAEAPQDPPQDYTNAVRLADRLLTIFDTSAVAATVLTREQVGELQVTLYDLFDSVHWVQRPYMAEEQDRLLKLTRVFSSTQYRCINCNDGRWVCAYHPHVRYDECECDAGEGKLCPVCNFAHLDPDWAHTFASNIPEHKDARH